MTEKLEEGNDNKRDEGDDKKGEKGERLVTRRIRKVG